MFNEHEMADKKVHKVANELSPGAHNFT